jgi:hypothetical protein
MVGLRHCKEHLNKQGNVLTDLSWLGPGSTMVEHLTYNYKTEGLNPTTREKNCEKTCYFCYSFEYLVNIPLEYYAVASGSTNLSHTFTHLVLKQC